MHQVLASPNYGKPHGWVLFTVVFLFPALRRDEGSSPVRPLSLRVAGQSWTPPAPGSPPSWVGPRSFAGSPRPPWAARWSHCSLPGAILGAGNFSSAPICARRCWRSPLWTRYQPDPISPVDPGDEAEGPRGSPGPGVGAPEWKPQGDVDRVVSRDVERDPWNPGRWDP